MVLRQQPPGPSAVWVNKPAADHSANQLPAGVTHHTFYSMAHETDVGYCIYLPPNYDARADKRYPVIYNLHGAGDNELHGFDDVRVLDAGIREGRWPAMIAVLPNGGMRTFYKDSHGTNASGERQRPAAIGPCATSGAGPQAKPKAAAVGHFHGSTPPPMEGTPALPHASAVGDASPAEGSHDRRFQSETLIIRELIPHIDATWRTIDARKGRCIEGHSMGGRGATRLAMKYPNLFCSLFNLAGNVPRTLAHFDPSAPDTYPNNYLGPDRQNYIDNDAYELLKKNLGDIKGKLRIQMWCGTQDTGHLATIRDFHHALLEADVDHTYMEIEGLGHRKKPILDRYRDVWFDYHVESLRQAADWK